MADRVLVEILVAAPIEAVWKAVREPQEMRRWFGWDYPNLAADLDMMFSGLKTVIVNEGERTLADEPDRFTFEAVGAQTIVRVIRSGPVTDDSWTGIYSDVVEGWLTFFQQLKFVLERHPGADRRTLYLNGRAASASTPQPAEALGLAPLSILPVGERYSVKTATGETLEGTVQYRGSYQLGLTVDGYGDGLIVLSARPRTAKSPYGGGNVIVTTYGLDDAAYAQVRERWAKWWRDTYEVIEIQP
jgi:hypothetical protein